MRKRSRMNTRKSKRIFTKTAKRIHPKNMVRPMRGGIRF